MAIKGFRSLNYTLKTTYPCLYFWLTTKVRLSRKQMAKGRRYGYMRQSAAIGHVPVWLDDDGERKQSVSDPLCGFGYPMVW